MFVFPGEVIEGVHELQAASPVIQVSDLYLVLFLSMSYMNTVKPLI